MYTFINDYSEGACPEIIKRITETANEQTVGYGMDGYCRHAAELIKKECERDDVDVHFLTGGTQANLTVITAALRPHQGVLCAQSGHINVHESGSIEATGHKVLPLSSSDGKITAAQVEDAYVKHINDETMEHTVQPKMVYISNPTETGTLYGKRELTALSKVCRDHGLILYLDGARLGYGMAAAGNDVFLKDIASLCDVFYIGGTKVGALFGEAVVIANEDIKKDFRYIIKQRGGMLAKGRLLGLQFETLFTDGLYYKISKNAIEQAMRIKKAFTDIGVCFLADSVTNQQFPILTDEQALQFAGRTEIWAKPDEAHTCIRFVTSWATKEEAVDALIEEIKQLKNQL